MLVTNRPDAKNALYQSYIKEGDNLLNRIQKLSRVIDLRLREGEGSVRDIEVDGIEVDVSLLR